MCVNTILSWIMGCEFLNLEVHYMDYMLTENIYIF